MTNVVAFSRKCAPHLAALEREAGELIESVGRWCVPWETEAEAAAVLRQWYRSLAPAKALEIARAAWAARCGL